MSYISIVSYLNSIPFIVGLENSSLLERYRLKLELPFECAHSLYSGKSDIALLPVGFLPKLKSYTIVSDYCIAADGRVKTVLLLSNKQLKEIKNIYLDYHSVTSVKLVRVLAKNFWQINPEWKQTLPENVNQIHEAAVVIGDKAFDLASKYKYAYDLADEWKSYTGLPFVFACWVSIKELEKDVIAELNNAFRIGLDSIPKIAADYGTKYNLSQQEVYSYLTENIKYKLTPDMKKSMDKFISML